MATKKKTMKKDVIYLSIDSEGYFQAEAEGTGGIKIGSRTNDVGAVCQVIRTVSNTLNLSNTYGELAEGFISGAEDFEQFMGKIGGREKYDPQRNVFSIELI